MATIMLAHGAMHSGWCWEQLVPLLEVRGHRVRAIDFPGSRGGTVDGVDLSSWTDTLVSLIDAEEGPIVLVGHSLGGMPISAAAERRPDRIAQLVYLAALLPQNGESAVALMEMNEDQSIIAGFEFSEDGRSFVVSGEVCGAIFYQDCAAPIAADAVARLVRQPLAVMMEPVRLSRERYGAVAKTYIATTRDAAVRYPFQLRMIARCAGVRVLTLNTGHSPFYSEPSALADMLDEVCAETAQAS